MRLRDYDIIYYYDKSSRKHFGGSIIIKVPINVYSDQV